MALEPERAPVSYTFFREQVRAGNVAEITSTGDTIEGIFEESVRYHRRPTTHLRSWLQTQRTGVRRRRADRPAAGSGRPVSAAQSPGGGLGGGPGMSRARRYTPEAGPRVTFADVAGIDEVQAEVQEVVDFLRNIAHR